MRTHAVYVGRRAARRHRRLSSAQEHGTEDRQGMRYGAGVGLRAGSGCRRRRCPSATRDRSRRSSGRGCSTRSTRRSEHGADGDSASGGRSSHHITRTRRAPEQVLRVDAAARLPEEPPLRPPPIGLPRRVESSTGRLLEFLGDDPQLGRRDANPFVLRALTLPAPRISLPRSIPDDHAAVQLAVENLAPARRGPPAQSLFPAGLRRDGVFVVQAHRDGPKTEPLRRHVVNAGDHGRFRRVTRRWTRTSRPSSPYSLSLSYPKTTPPVTRPARARWSIASYVHARRLLALDFRGEVLNREDDLVRR